MEINKDTKLCISIASKPSNLGTMLFNAAFEHTGLNYVYKAFQVDPKDLEDSLRGVRALGIIGCGVSMPHKVTIISHLNSVCKSAQEIGAVNTVINKSGVLSGYNTDYNGALKCLTELDKHIDTAILIGTGGASMAIAYALSELKIPTTIIGRNNEKAIGIAKKYGFKVISFSDINKVCGDLLINATPVGIYPEINECIVQEDVLSRFKIALDVVVNPLETKFIRLAKSLGLTTIPGYKMALYQAAEQFRLYTGIQAPFEVMESKLKEVTKCQ